MALDTQDKRAAAIHVGLPWRGLLPQPDAGALKEGDRQQVAYYARVAIATGTTYEDDIVLGAGTAIVAAAVLDREGALTLTTGHTFVTDTQFIQLGSVSFGMGGTFVTKDKEDKLLEIVLTSTFIPLGVKLTIPWDGSPIGA